VDLWSKSSFRRRVKLIRLAEPRRRKASKEISVLWALYYGLLALGTAITLSGLVLENIVLVAKRMVCFGLALPVVAILVEFGALFAFKDELGVGALWVATGAVMAGIVTKCEWLKAGRLWGFVR
jgi:hypothetical protein